MHTNYKYYNIKIFNFVVAILKQGYLLSVFISVIYILSVDLSLITVVYIFIRNKFIFF